MYGFMLFYSFFKVGVRFKYLERKKRKLDCFGDIDWWFIIL